MVDTGDHVNRFVCPSDRQLALRAKLKTGWSIKTGSVGYQTSPGHTSAAGGLDPQEQATILEVIQRAEQLDIREQERVGKLVDRLENMRRNALGRSAAQCLLCGDRFGLLGAQSVQCIACMKLVCQKCAIEAWLGVRRTTPITGTGSLKERGEISKQRKDQWLCKICAETREIWKKSGAWFFKGLPKYILPGEDKKRIGKLQSPPKKCRADDDSSSDEEDRKGFLSSTYVENNTSPFHDQPHSLPHSDHSPGQYSRQTSSSDSQKSCSASSMPYHAAPISTSPNSYFYGGQNQDNNGVAIITNYGSNRDIRREDIYEKGYEKYERYEREKYENRSNHDKWDEEGTNAAAATGYGTTYSSNMYLGDMIRRDSMASRSMSEWTWSDEKTSPSGLSVGSTSTTGFKQDDLSSKPVSPSTASLSLTLTYDSIRDTLHCLIHRAKALPAMDINGLADPFCKLNILPEGKLSTRLRTKTVHKTRNPEFNESLTFYEITENDLLKKSLHVLVLDDDKYGHDYMGEAKVSLAGLRVQKSINITVALERLLADDCSLGPDTNLPSWYEDPWCRGQILISLCYSTKRRALLVTIVRCANLLPMDNNGFSDPFVKMHLKPDPHHKKHKTSIKWKNLNPYYNEEFPFETRPNELSTQSLYITVWDKDYGKSNDYLGGLVLGGAGSKGRRLKHWVDMIRYPDHRHEYWHSLTEDLLTD